LKQLVSHQALVMIDGSNAPPPPTELILVQNRTEEVKQLVPTDE